MNGTTIKTMLNEPKSKNDIKYANESFRYESILDHNVSERVFKMLSEAENLIEDGYVPLYLLSDPEIYEAERIKIFATSWNFLAHESEIPYPGDYVVRYIEQTPLIVVRGEDNIIRVFLNVCPHKGREFVKAEIGNTSHIRCPYHGFVYNTRGKLVGCPVQKHAIGDIINYNDFNMYRINSEIYHGFIFGNLDPKPKKDLLNFLGDFKFYFDLVSNKSDTGLTFTNPQRWVVPFNWKAAADNFAGDIYHAFTAHATGYALFPKETIKANAVLTGLQVDAGNGHGIAFSRIIDSPQWYGNWWPELIKKAKNTLTESEYKFWTKYSTSTIIGNVFPNFGFLNAGMPFKGGSTKESIAPILTFRVWNPISSDKTQIWNWFAIENDAPDDLKKYSYLAYQHSFTANGVFEEDDMENWITQTHAGKSMLKLKLAEKVGEYKPLINVGAPGKIQSYPSDIGSMSFWRELVNKLLE